jgi:histidyl-tRNA synthetase
MKALIDQAPSMLDSLDEESRVHFEAVREMLGAAGVEFQVNPRLVRGLDYYTRTVFEWITDSLGAQGAVCAGGRYDGLVELLGGRATPAIGFAMGVERLIDLVAAEGIPVPESPPHAYLVAEGDASIRKALLLAEELRTNLPGLRLVNNCGGGSFKSQFRRADRSGALWALVLGEEELKQNTVVLKPLRSSQGQETLAMPGLAARLGALLADKA